MFNNSTVLVVDDDRDIVNLVALHLANNGYTPIKASSGEEALQLLNENTVDLVILDIMMPKMNGIEICQEIRKTSNIPIIFLTAKTEDSDIVYGLSIGADDYILKPFNPAVLMAKISTILRRSNLIVERQTDIITIGELIIDSKKYTVIVDNNIVKLTPKEFEILHLLASNQGKVYNLTQIHDLIWGDQDFITENAIMVHIANLRNKIEKNPKHPIYIKTIWGFGYKI